MLTTDFFVILAEPLIRSDIYHLLAKGFKHPTPALFEKFQNGTYLRQLEDQLSALLYFDVFTDQESDLIGQVCQELEQLDFLDFENKYIDTFVTGTPLPACPLFEGYYVDRASRTELNNEIAGIYQQHGMINGTAGSQREPPDHLCTELEFLHFLAYKESQAWGQDEQGLLNRYFLAQRGFLEQHMIGWLPKLAVKIKAETGLPFYPNLARIAEAYIDAEFAIMSAMQAKL